MIEEPFAVFDQPAAQCFRQFAQYLTNQQNADRAFLFPLVGLVQLAAILGWCIVYADTYMKW